MPPRRMNHNAINRLVVDRVAATIAEYEANRANMAGPARAGGVGPVEEIWHLKHAGVRLDTANLTPSEEFKKMMTDEYCPRNELQRMEHEFLESDRNVTSSKPATTHEAICMAYNLMDQAVRFKAARSSEANKRKWEDHQTPAEGKVYAGNLPLGNRCKLHHNGQCTVMCRNCQKVGHQSKDCKSKKTAKVRILPLEATRNR
ncbi:putative reverse transcriptase domain-containing protein [Tanacetum coccineum]|uniref:Reverse transcriptase domain-containing protein n=1 Tax=Tanacetum coccineum TaxID=301880 RepID=A0ABQ5CEC6_9ASTR